jgi:hypothetical protein
MALVVFLRGVNVGGHRRFRPSVLARELSDYGVVNVGAAGTLVVRKPGPREKFRAELLRKLPFEATVVLCDGRDLIRMEMENPFGTEPPRPDIVRFVSILSKADRGLATIPCSLPPRGKWFVLRKAFRWMREWSLVGSIIAAAIAVVIFSANNAIKDAEFRGGSDQRLKTIEAQNTKTEQRLGSIESALLSLRARQAAVSPGDKTNQIEAVLILEDARKKSIRIPVTDVEQAGTRFVDAAKAEPSAWNAALQFLGYRSFLNTAVSPSTNAYTDKPTSWDFSFSAANTGSARFGCPASQPRQIASFTSRYA